MAVGRAWQGVCVVEGVYMVEVGLRGGGGMHGWGACMVGGHA